ncbi:MAG: hypothetical protein WBI44_02735 [Syntrophaceticus sp.]
MRTLSVILTLACGLLVLFLSYLQVDLERVINPDATISILAVLVGILLLIGGAFSFKLPKVSAIICIIAALFAGIGAMNDLPSMTSFIIMCLLLAGMNYAGARQSKEPVTKDPPDPSL